MKKLALAFVLSAAATTAFAGGTSEPVIEPEVIVAGTSSSGGDNWVGILMTLLTFGTALSN